jgi:hypothetical protein
MWVTVYANMFGLSASVLYLLSQVSESVSWWARLSCLEFLQVFVFHNMAIVLSQESWVREVRLT